MDSLPEAPTRLEAIRRALKVAGPSERVLLRQPEQPPLSPAGLSVFLKAAGNNPAAAAAVPVTSTYKEVVDGRVRSTVPRERLFRLRGIMVIERRRLAEALELNHKSGWHCPDEVSLCWRAGIPVQLVPGDFSLQPADQ